MADSRYVLFKKIARGGMAEIYLGKQVGDDGFQRTCCIKRILPHFSGDQEFIEMFRDEAHICKRLQHANIVRVEGFEEVEGSYAMIMEYINGADLRTVLSICEKSNQQLAIPMACYAIAEAARGLHYAHTKKDEVTDRALDIVHRDISPQNILLSFEGEVKVTDFGIADADNKATETKPGVVKGKYSYMSPEQISAKQVDARTDVFALSIILWELLAMKRLFQGENEVQTIQLVRSCKITRDLATLNPQVDPELIEIVYKGLKKDPSDRYESAADLEKVLRRHISQKYSDFVVNDLSSFLKKVMVERRQENLENLRELLSHTTSHVVGEDTAGIHLNLEQPLEAPEIKIRSDATQSGLSAPRQPSMSSPPKPQPSRAKEVSSSATQARKKPIHPQQRATSSTPWGAIFLILTLVVCGLGYFAYKKYQASLRPANLIIYSTPRRVKVTFNNVQQEDGDYVDTPYKILDIPAGRHHIFLSRPGFRDEEKIVTLQAGKERKRNIALARRVQMAPVLIRLSPGVNRSVFVQMDDGLIEKAIQPKKSLKLQDVTFGEEHELKIFASEGGELIFVCQFFPRANSWQRPHVVEILPKKESGQCSNPPF